MGTIEQGFRDSKTKETIKALMLGGFKTIYIRDAANRIEVVYEAPIKAAIGEPCLRTKLKYVDGAAGTNKSTLAEEEDVVAWPGYEIIQVGAGNDIDNVL